MFSRAHDLVSSATESAFDFADIVMPIDDGEARNREDALYTICFQTRLGTVEGVEFDFRHELLDASEWKMFDAVGVSGGYFSLGRQRGLPCIWFPWYGEFDRNALDKEVDECFKAEVEYRKAHSEPSAWG